MIGNNLYGGGLFNGEYEDPFALDTPNSGSLRRTQIGFEQLGRRIYSKSDDYSLLPTTAGIGTFAEIGITSVSGALVGKIRTDIQYSSVVSLDFTLDDMGCADFRLRLNRLPEFPILPFSILEVTIGEASEPHYKGEITYPDDIGTQREFFEFRGFGLRNYLKGLKADTDFSAGTDVGEVIDELAQTWIAPFAPINYNSSKIDTSTGVILASDIELGKYFLNKILDTLADMANYNWGVDGNGDFFWEPKTSSTVKTLFAGYDMTSFEPKLNLQDVKNVIMVQRQEGRGSGGSGWAVAGIFNDDTSVAKYGRKELNYQIPGFFSDADAQIVGENLRDEFSEPKITAKADGLLVQTADDILERGQYRVILPQESYSSTVNDVDDEGEWTIFGSGLTKSDDTTNFVHGASSLKLDYTSALNARAEIPLVVDIGLIERIRFYIRGSKLGNYLTLGVGTTSWDENTTDLPITAVNAFFLFDWDVTNLGLSSFEKLAIRVDEGATVATTINIDKIDVKVKGFKPYTLTLTRARYKFAPKEQLCDVEFGTLPPRMENYISSLLAQSEELNFTQEVRAT